jgi:hypothetical protein
MVGFSVFWLVILGTAIIALRVIGLDLAPSLVARLQDVLPRIVTSGLVLLLGIPLALAAARLLNALLIQSGVRSNRIREQSTGALLVAFTVLIALDQLGLAAHLVLAVVIAIVASAGLAVRARVRTRLQGPRPRLDRRVPARVRRMDQAPPASVSEAFIFHTPSPLESPAGQVATDIQSLRDGIAACSDASLFQHVTRMPVRFPHARDVPENDFARWVGDVMQMPEVSERLAFVGSASTLDFGELRGSLLGVLDRVQPKERKREAPEGSAVPLPGGATRCSLRSASRPARRPR